MKIKPAFFWFLVVAFVCAVGGYALEFTKEPAGRLNCDDFETWEGAQEAFESDPNYSRLDGNGDGIACNSKLK